MKITDKRNTKEKMLTLNDLSMGDVFTFLTGDLTDWVCLVTDNGFVTLSDGDSDFDLSIYGTMPVEELETELIVMRK